MLSNGYSRIWNHDVLCIGILLCMAPASSWHRHPHAWHRHPHVAPASSWHRREKQYRVNQVMRSWFWLSSFNEGIRFNGAGVLNDLSRAEANALQFG